MNMENKIKDIIEMLEDARKELTFLFEEIESTFPLDEWDDDDEDFK